MKIASGKLVIIIIVAVALVAAGTSWWFRYTATHRAAEFWGSDGSQLIRDAPQVTLYRNPLGAILHFDRNADTNKAIMDDATIDLSHARGLVHLRNALLEDQSYIWPRESEARPQEADDIFYWLLVFSEPSADKSIRIHFAKDCKQAARVSDRPDGTRDIAPISVEPIAAGLRKMFGEFASQKPDAADPR